MWMQVRGKRLLSPLTKQPETILVPVNKGGVAHEWSLMKFKRSPTGRYLMIWTDPETTRQCSWSLSQCSPLNQKMDQFYRYYTPSVKNALRVVSWEELQEILKQ